LYIAVQILDMAIQAILTGDIVNSTQLTTRGEKKLLACLRQLLSPYQYEFYRGDSFQVYVKRAEEALPLALLCRTAAISIGSNGPAASDIRISIGIGDVKMPVTSLGTAKGEAFILSGRAFDAMASNSTRLAIAATEPLANEGLHITADYCNALFSTMTGKQAAVIFELLKGESQQAVATRLKKSKSTISQHVTAGRWLELERLLQHYKNIINLLP